MRDGHGAMVGRDGHGVLHLNIVPCTLYAAHYEGIPRAFPYGLLVIGFVATIKEFRYQVILHAFPYGLLAIGR